MNAPSATAHKALCLGHLNQIAQVILGALRSRPPVSNRELLHFIRTAISAARRSAIRSINSNGESACWNCGLKAAQSPARFRAERRSHYPAEEASTRVG